METIDLIKCPCCHHYHTNYEDYLEVGDMSGGFEMECEKCGEPFNVDFYSTIHFTTTEK